MPLFGGNNATVTTTFKGKDDMTPVVRGIRNTMDGFKRDAATGFGLGAGISVFNAATQAFGMFTDFVGDGITALMRIEEINAQTAAALRSTGNAAGRTAEQISGLADSIEEATGVEAESIQIAQNALLTFTNVTGERFDRATVAIVDMSKALGTDMQSAALQVGKALQDPVKGLTALTRAGVSFSAEQADVIRDLTRTGRAAEAQGLILAELERQFGGSAAAWGETTAGQMAKLNNELGEISEKLAYSLMPLIRDFAEYLRTDVVPEVDGWIDGLNDAGRAVSMLSSLIGRNPADGMQSWIQAELLQRQLDTVRTTFEQTADAIRAAVAGALPEGRPGSLFIPDSALEPPDLEPVKQVFKAAVVDIRNTVKDGRERIVEQFRLMAWQSKHPFRETNYANWLEEQQARAMRKMRRAAKEGRWGAFTQYAGLVQDIKDEMNTLPGAAGNAVERSLAIMADAVRRIRSMLTIFGTGETVGGVEGDGKLRKPRRRNRNRRALGGPVHAGESYVVNENGTEVLTMGNRSGYITPAHRTGGGQPSIVINLDGRTIWRSMDRHMGRALSASA